jgi:hypothetical protein
MEDTPKTVQLGGKEYLPRYTISEGLEITKRLGRRGIDVLQDLVGSDPDGKFSLRFDLEALLVCLQVGLRREKRFSEDDLAKLIQEHMDNDRKIGDLIGPVWNALNSSGCFGFKLKEQQPEADEGKGDAPKESST